MIITFYSFKGGVGRTLALANIGVVLANMGHRVLTVDFDLEAPGLSKYYENAFNLSLADRLGLIDMLEQLPTDGNEHGFKDWRPYVNRLPLAGTGELSVMTAGQVDDRYATRVIDLNWDRLYRQRGAGELIERLRQDWLDEYEFVLIDSRTGVTDIAGITTIQLPDVLVPVFTANDQSLRGAIDTVRRSQAARMRLARERGPALVFPLPSRFDDRTESEKAREWLGIFAKELAEFYEPWLPIRYEPRVVLERVKLPYVSYYSFGEEMPVQRDNPNDVASLGFALRSAAELIGSRFERLDELLSPTLRPITDDSSHVAEAVLSDLPPSKEATALNILARLAADPDENGRRVPTELLGNDDVIEVLSSAGIIDRIGSGVALHDVSLADRWKRLDEYIEYHRELLDWSVAMRSAFESDLGYVLEGELLARGRELYRYDPGLLTAFELYAVESGESVWREEHRDSARHIRVRLTSILLGGGALVGLLVALLLIAVIPALPFTVLAVGFVGGGLVGAYFGTFLSRRIVRVSRRGEFVVEGVDRPLTRRLLATELRSIGYRSAGTGNVMEFRLERLARGEYGRITRWALTRLDSSLFDVAVRELRDRSVDSPAFVVDAPEFVMRVLDDHVRVSKLLDAISDA